MGVSPRVWGVGRLVLLAAALIVAYVAAFGVAMRVTTRARDVAVPNLVGEQVNTASQTLTRLGLLLRVEETPRRDPDLPPGVIVAQEPSPGTRTRPPRNVRVWVSAGAGARPVPALVGTPGRVAVSRVEGEGLRLASLAEIRTTDYPIGSVVAQAPGAGEESEVVALLVNEGERGRTYVMPDLIGTVASEAEDALRARGFRAAVVSSYRYPGVPPGIVLRQKPEAGYQIAPGDTISLEVSQ